MILADFHLPRRLRPTVTAVARVTCPDDLETLGLAEHVTLTVEHALRAYPAGVRVGLVAGLLALEASTVLRHGKPFSRLPRDRARAVFASWWHSPIAPMKMLARAVKSLCSMAYYDSPAVRDKIDYRPEAWIAERVHARLLRYGVAIERAEDEVTAPDPLVRLVPRRSHA
jgi:hypothetical protein